MVTTLAAIDSMNTFDEEPVAVIAEPAVNIGAKDCRRHFTTWLLCHGKHQG